MKYKNKLNEKHHQLMELKTIFCWSILLTLGLDSYSDTMDWRTCEQSMSNLDCTVNRTVVKCVQPMCDCMYASFDDDDGNYHFQTSPRNAHLFYEWNKKVKIKIYR